MVTLRLFWRRDVEGLPTECVISGVSREDVDKVLAEERQYPHAMFGLSSQKQTLVVNWNDLMAITVTEVPDA